MTALKKYNLQGESKGEVQVDKSFLESKAHSQMIKDYIVALRANARQWSANTKGRSEVEATTKKPHPQKGQGRARQGRISSPQYKGGGIVFGPKPKFDQHVRINKKERRAAIRSILAEKIRDNKVSILEDTDLDAPKTKAVASFMKACEISGKRTLFLGESKYNTVESEGKTQKVAVQSNKHGNFRKSLNNIPKTAFSLAANVSGYDVLVAHHIVFTEAAWQELNEWLQPTAAA